MYSSQCGLFPCVSTPDTAVKREDFPLLNAKVHYDVSDVQILANLTQNYISNASTDVEIRYIFPLPADASVCGFKAVIDGKRTIKGIVKEKAKAKADYDKAVSQGMTAALLEQGNVEIFQISLGNIRPKTTIEVHISFVSIISHDGSLDSLRLTFPSAIAPRYGSPPDGIFDSSGLSDATSSKNILDFSVAVEMASHIKSITSPSHPITTKLGGSTLESTEEYDTMKAHVSLTSPTLLEKDIVLALNCQGLDKPRCMVESFSPEEGAQEYTDAYALTLVPRFELPSLPTQEYIFLVDRSGSMEDGSKMDAVRSALQILLMSLPSRGTSFNIMSFGSNHSSLWPSSVKYSADSVKRASKHVDSMTANFGGTEIRSAIEAAFSSRVARPNGKITSSSVFILTDGEAYDLDGVRSTIQDTVAKAKKEGLLLRTFCMGIGNAVSKAMCDTIARAGQGAAAFVGEEEKPDQKLMGLLRASRGAIVEDISIDWGAGDDDGSNIQDFEIISTQDASPEPPKDAGPISLFDESSITSSETTVLGPQTFPVKLPPPPRVQQAPSTESLPPLYPGFRTSLFAIVRRGEDGNTTPSKKVLIKGSVLGRPVILEVPVSQTSKPTAEKPAQVKMLHCLAARALVQSIEDKAANDLSEVARAEVVRIAERYGLASSQTSFVAVDELGNLFDTGGDDIPPVVPESGFVPGVARMMPYSITPPGAGTRILNRSRSTRDSSDCVSAAAQPCPAPMSAAMAPSPSLVSSPTSFGFGGVDHSTSIDNVVEDQPSPRTSKKEKIARLAQSRNLFGFSKKFKTSPMTDSPVPSSIAPSSPTIETFARAQSFDGSFASSASLFQLLVQQAKAPAMPVALGAGVAHKETVWCTLLCVAYLEAKFADDKEVWIVLVEKAMQFVEDTLEDAGMHDVTETVRGLKEDAQKCIP